MEHEIYIHIQVDKYYKNIKKINVIILNTRMEGKDLREY